MKPYYQDHHITLYNKDCRSMSDLPDESVQCVVTSPPYWGLRKYAGVPDLIWGDGDCEHQWGDTIPNPMVKSGKHGPASILTKTADAQHAVRKESNQGAYCQLCGAWKGSYGLEPTPEMYINHTIEILREIRRVLRKDGVVFWNIGDSYSGSGKGIGQDNHGKAVFTDEDIAKTDWNKTNLKPKDLCLIPFRVAIAAQEDGWWVRSVIIWSKPNPMPESVTDRPTNSHEYILMLTKSSKYYWDASAARERGENTPWHAVGYANKPGEYLGKEWFSGDIPVPGRNIRSVWDFPTQPYPEAHFAVFPEKLPEICIKAATPEEGCCSKCGAPWSRVLEKVVAAPASWRGSKFDDGKNLINHPNVGRREEARTKTAYGEGTSAGRLALLRQQSRENGGEYINQTKTKGWQPTCKCNAPKSQSIVLDPFAGAGTTLWVAKKLNRKAVGYELSKEYCELIVKRNRQQVLI